MHNSEIGAALERFFAEVIKVAEEIEKVDEADLVRLFQLTGMTLDEFAPEIVKSPEELQDTIVSTLLEAYALPQNIHEELGNWPSLDEQTRTRVIKETYDVILQKTRPVSIDDHFDDMKTKAQQEAEIYKRERTNSIYHALGAGIDKAFHALHDQIEYGQVCDWYATSRIDGDKKAEYVSLEVMFHEELASWPRSNNKHVVLVYGCTGHGKTSFINHYYLSYLPRAYKEEANKIIFVRVHVSSSSEIRNFEEDVDHQISDELEKQVPKIVLNRENILKMWETIYDFDKDFYKRLVQLRYPSKEHEEARLRWIESRYSTQPGDRRAATRHADWNRARINFLAHLGYKIVLFFDNADQASEAIQMKAFRMARHKLEWLPVDNVTAVVAVRDYFYERALYELAAQSFEVQKFYVPPPRLEEVIDKRAMISTRGCEEAYGQKEFKLDFVTPTLPKFSFTVTDVEKFFRSVFVCFEHPQVKPLLNQVANYNYRVVLGMIHMVLSSPLVSDENILDFLETYKTKEKTVQARERPKPLMKPHEVLHCLLASDPGRHFFSKQESPILNLFDIGDSRHPGNSLVQIHLLSICKSRQWVSPYNLILYLKALGHYEEMIKVTIDRLLGARLLYSREGIQLVDQLKHIEGTAASLAYLDDIAFRLYYLQLTAYNISNISEEFKKKLPEKQKPGAPNSQILDRLKSAVILYHHVRISEQQLKARATDQGLLRFLGIRPINQKLHDSIVAQAKKVLEKEPAKNTELISWLKDPDVIS